MRPYRQCHDQTGWLNTIMYLNVSVFFCVENSDYEIHEIHPWILKFEHNAVVLKVEHLPLTYGDLCTTYCVCNVRTFFRVRIFLINLKDCIHILSAWKWKFCKLLISQSRVFFFFVEKVNLGKRKTNPSFKIVLISESISTHSKQNLFTLYIQHTITLYVNMIVALAIRSVTCVQVLRIVQALSDS